MSTPTPTPTPTPFTGLTPRFTPHAEEPFSAPDTNLQVRYDLFPAEVTFRPAPNPAHPGATAAELVLPKCRVLITLDEVYVFADGPTRPVLVFFDRLDDIQGDPRSGFTLTPSHPDLTFTGSLTATPSRGCGCGSRLRGARLFGRISYVPSTP